MTLAQIKYFIVAAKCRNFTQAAAKLYITQPALSRQIASMEMELNMQLFVRSNKSVELTPAAVVLLTEFEKIYDAYNLAIAKASSSFEGLNGELNIGILDGTYVGDLLPTVLKHFNQFYPQVKISLQNYSFNDLVEKLYSEELDFAITLLFDIKDHENLQYQIIEKTRDHIVVHKDHPIAHKKQVSLADFKDDTFIMVSREDSEISSKLIIDSCKNAGFMPKVKFTTTLQEEMLWVEAGVGVCILDTRNKLNQGCHSSVCFLDIDPISDPSLTLVWNPNRYNPMKEVFRNNLLLPEAETS